VAKEKKGGVGKGVWRQRESAYIAGVGESLKEHSEDGKRRWLANASEKRGVPVD